MSAALETDIVCAVVLAAGAADRFGSPKALAPWKGETLLQHTLRTLHKVTPHCFVVTGAHRKLLQPFLLSATELHNPTWQRGLGSSVATGVAGCEAYLAKVNRIILVTVDQPFMKAENLAKAVALSRETGLCVFSNDGEVSGPPVVLPSPMFERAKQLCGERGLKSVLEEAAITHVAVAREELMDVDHPDDLLRLAAITF